MKIGVILAGGKSSRFKSLLPKGLHCIDGVRIIDRIIDSLSFVDKIYVIVNEDNYYFYKDINNVEFLFQDKLNGTGSAFYCINGLFNDNDDIIVINSDTFYFEKTIIENFYNQYISSSKNLGLIVEYKDNPSSYGRVFRKGNFITIVEESELNGDSNSLVNLGIYVFSGIFLKKKIKLLNNDFKENKITLLFDNEEVFLYFGDIIVMGINDKEDFYLVNKEFYKYICLKHIKNGVKIYDPDSTYISEGVDIGRDVEIYPNNYILGATKINDNSCIYPFCYIEDSFIGNKCNVGPYTRLKKGSWLDREVEVASFVEVKKSTLKKGVKAKHHAYLGDCVIGENTNIGCGVIVANFDGRKKNQSIIENNCFIGSNVTIISPVKISSNSVIAAGSTIVSDVKANSLAIARNKQINKDEYYLK